MSVMVTDRSRFAGAVAGEAVAVAGLPGAGAGAGGVVVAPPVGPGLAGTPTLVGGAAAADPGVMVRSGAAADVEAVLPVALVEPGRGGRTVLGAPAAVDGLLVVDVPVPAVAAEPVGAAPVVPVGPGLAGTPTLVGGEAAAGPGVMVRVGAPVDGEAVLPSAPATIDVVVVVDAVPAVGAAPVTAAPVVAVGPGFVGTATLVGGAATADPGVMVSVGVPTEGEALGLGVPVDPGRVGRFVFDGFGVAAGPVVDAGAMEDEGAAAANVDPGCSSGLALDGMVSVGGR